MAQIIKEGPKMLYNMHQIVAYGVMTQELAERLEKMLTSDDREMQLLGQSILEPIRGKYYTLRERLYPTFGLHGKII